MHIEFSPANHLDKEEILQFWQSNTENHSRPFDSIDAIIRLLERDPQTLILARFEGKIVGTVIAALDAWRGSIYRLAVDKNIKGQGIGRQLMENAEERLKLTGATRVNAVVCEENVEAHAFYQRLGYSKQLEWARWIKNL